MKRIQIFCDDISYWWHIENLNIKVYRKRHLLTNEPYLEFELFGVRWEMYNYGLNNSSEVPDVVKSASYEGCRPDLWFYDPIINKIILGCEDTNTAPVGNAQKQRMPRPLWAIDNKVPFIYKSPKIGMDNSQNSKRKITGPFKELLEKNPTSFISEEEYDLMKILREVSLNQVSKYLLKSPFVIQPLGKKKVSVKLSDKLTKIKEIIDSDTEVYNVIEKKGNIFMVPLNSATGLYLGLQKDTILIIGSGWKSSKKSNGPSDPFAGGILMVYYINKWMNNIYDIVVLSTHDCSKYDTKMLIKNNNKMTHALSKVTKLMDLCENTFEVNHYNSESFCYKSDDESIATYCRVMDLKNQNIVADFIQPPHGSWSSNDGLNTRKRDEKRADIYHQNSPNGEEGKINLSDVIKHINKRGLVHDFYYYLNEDCKEVPAIIQDRLIKVEF